MDSDQGKTARRLAEKGKGGRKDAWFSFFCIFPHQKLGYFLSSTGESRLFHTEPLPPSAHKRWPRMTEKPSRAPRPREHVLRGVVSAARAPRVEADSVRT